MQTWASFKSSKNHSLSNIQLKETRNSQVKTDLCIETRSAETNSQLFLNDFSQIERNLNKSAAFFEEWLFKFQKSQSQKYDRLFANLKKRIVGFFKKDVDVSLTDFQIRIRCLQLIHALVRFEHDGLSEIKRRR